MVGCSSDDGGGSAADVPSDVGGDPFDVSDVSTGDDTVDTAQIDTNEADSSDGATPDSAVDAPQADTADSTLADTADTAEDVEEPLPATWTNCTEDDDCAVAFPGCCDLCNGGEPVASRAESVDFVVEFLEENGSPCPAIPCTTEPCPAIKAFCNKGTCDVRFETNAEGGCSALDEVDCEASPVCKIAVGTPLAQYCDPELEPEPIPTGCVLSTSCFDVDTCAQHPSGFIQMVYEDSCYPAGWTPCGPSYCDKVTPSCELGQPPPIDQYCVRGVPTDDGELIDGTSPITVEYRPKGCFSQTCTVVQVSDCAASLFEDNRIVIDGEYCFGLTAGATCAGDCLGAAPAPCGTFDLGDGLYQIEALGRKKSFTIPSVVPVGGFCLEIDHTN